MNSVRFHTQNLAQPYWDGTFRKSIKTVSEEIKFTIATKVERFVFSDRKVTDYNNLVNTIYRNICVKTE